MDLYADVQFYNQEYLLGRNSKIPDGEFAYWSMQASGEIRRYTFGRVDAMENVPDQVKLCCCEIAETLYAAEAARDSNGMLLQSYGNDGETGTFQVDDFTAFGVQKNVSRITRKWLAGTGLMYCGGGRYESEL